MKKMFTRLAALALVASVCLSCFVVSVSASVSAGDWVDTDSQNLWSSVLSVFGLGFDALDYLNSQMLPIGQRSLDELTSIANSFNSLITYGGGSALLNTTYRRSLTDQGRLDALLDALWSGNPKFVVDYDICLGVYRIKESTSNRWVVNSEGYFPYCPDPSTSTTPSTTVTDNPSNSYRRQWVESEDAIFSSFVRVTQDALATAIVDLGRGALAKIKLGGDWFYVIYDSVNDAYLCNRSNQVYAAPVESAKSAVENPVINNYTDGTVVIEDGDNIQEQNVNVEVSPNFDYQTLVEIENALFHPLVVDGETVVIGDGTQFIDSLTYNTDDRSYTLNTYDYTINVTNNYYEYNFYTYNIQYTYNNTYVTYIGSTAEYQPTEYELYYQLPDGRSSADLTEEDIAGLSFQFADCVNYNRGVTDESLLALYHFDGSTDDDSYYNTADSFTWNTGASITYMESNAFDGCLYLDEKEHEFTLTLPQDLAYSNFTLSFRYYQNSATTSTNNDNYITAGSYELLSWSEQYLYGLGTTQLSTGLSVGTWQELALIRVGYTLYFYHNGVEVSSASFTSFLGNTLTFHFGGSSKAYAMLDELQVLSFAWVSNGGNYTVSAVPFDTNEVLVLPTAQNHVVVEEIPGTDDVVIHHKELSDIYVDCVYDSTPIWKMDCEDFRYSPHMCSSSTSRLDAETYSGTSYSVPYLNQFQSFSGNLSPSVSNGLIYFPNVKSSLSLSSDGLYFNGNSAPVMLLGAWIYGYASFFGDMNTNPGYTVTVVYDDYSIESRTISYSNSSWNSSTSGTSVSFTHNGSSLSVCLDHYYSKYYGSYNVFSLYGNLGVRYIEMVEGSTPNPHQIVYDYYEWDEVIPGEEYVPGQDYYETLIASNTAAVQTDIPISGYTVGGVRPTFPVRGDVWFPVEGSRISGVQVYNGRAWEEVNARWWTGSRWIPIYAFDLITLEDMWDVGSYDGGDVEASITSEYGFWNWWKNQWLDFRGWLSSTSLGSGASGGGSSSSGSGSSLWETVKDTASDALGELIGAVFDFITEVLELALDLVYDLLEFFFGFLSSTVIAGIGAFFSAFTDGSLFEGLQETTSTVDADGNTVEAVTATLPEGVPAVFAFFAGVILALPAELRSILIFGVAVLFLIAVLKMAQS